MQNTVLETKEEFTTDLVYKTKREKIKLIVAAGIGNFLEIFDFTVYSFFAAIIGDIFFHSDTPGVSLLISVSVFGVGFVMRPLGSIIIGSYADRNGRKAAMLLTIVLMAIGSALIGFVPSYETIGIFAPFLIVIGRLFQGFSAGGEIGTSTTLLMESGGRNQRGFFVSWQFIGQGLSALCGSLFAAELTDLLTREQLYSWGWRIPFIFSLIVIPVGLYIRAHIHDTYEAEARSEDVAGSHPFRDLMTKHFWKVILCIFMILPGTAFTYVMVFYMPNYLKLVTNMNGPDAFRVSSYASIIFLVFSIASGFLCDRLERRRWMAISLMVIKLIVCYFCLLYVSNFYLFMAFYTVAMVVYGLSMSIAMVMIMEAFEQHIRATAASVIYAFGVTIFGGTAQIIVTQLLRISDGNTMAPFWYLGTAFVIGIIATFIFVEIRHSV